MTKAELRVLYKNKRRTLSKDEVLSYSDKIFQNLIRAFDFKKGANVHVFLPIQKFKEVETLNFIEWCWKNEVNVYVPRMIGDSLLSMPYHDNTELELNSWGISEPKIKHNEEYKHPKFDLVICPLLYCDSLGNRVGYGKGFYDRLFIEINSDVIKVGVNYFAPDELITDVDPFDVPLDYLTTTEETVSFGFISKFKK